MTISTKVTSNNSPQTIREPAIRELNRHLIQDFILNGLIPIVICTILPSKSGELVEHQPRIIPEKSRFSDDPDHTAKADQLNQPRRSPFMKLVVLTRAKYSFCLGHDPKAGGNKRGEFDARSNMAAIAERPNVFISMKHNSETFTLSCSLSEIADRTLSRQTVGKLMKKLKIYRFCIYVRSSQNAPICSLETVNW